MSDRVLLSISTWGGPFCEYSIPSRDIPSSHRQWSSNVTLSSLGALFALFFNTLPPSRPNPETNPTNLANAVHILASRINGSNRQTFCSLKFIPFIELLCQVLCYRSCSVSSLNNFNLHMNTYDPRISESWDTKSGPSFTKSVGGDFNI